MLRRLFRKDEPLPDLLTSEAFYAPIHAYADDRLSAAGYQRTQQGKWVERDGKSARRVIELRHYKGQRSAPVWGFSLNYVPHFNNSCTKLSWHRTVKSARIDVFPFDECDRIDSLTRFALPDRHATSVASVFGTALDEAGRFFSCYRRTQDLLPLFDRLHDDRGPGLGYWNYTNMPVAHAFTLRVTGSRQQGLEILERYAGRMQLEDRPKADLLSRFEAAEAEPLLR